jgi:hypothetical protein
MKFNFVHHVDIEIILCVSDQLFLFLNIYSRCTSPSMQCVAENIIKHIIAFDKNEKV